MVWTMASIPFWLLGLFWGVGSVTAITHRYPYETPVQVCGQSLISLLLCGVLWVIAAKVAGA